MSLPRSSTATGTASTLNAAGVPVDFAACRST
jgi:hypothetical protein